METCARVGWEIKEGVAVEGNAVRGSGWGVRVVQGCVRCEGDLERGAGEAASGRGAAEAQIGSA